MKFSLVIHLGNEACQTPDDIACLLEEVAHKLRDKRGVITSRARATLGNCLFSITSPVFDITGNKVGNWRIR